MKTIATALLLLAASCGAADFDITRQIPSETLPAAPVALPGEAPQAIDIPLHQTLDASSTGIVNSIYLTDLYFTASSGDWSFLQSIDIYISSVMKDSTLPQIVVASASGPGATTELDFTPTANINLVPYINEGAQLTASAIGTPPSQAVTFDGQLTLHVHPL